MAGSGDDSINGGAYGGYQLSMYGQLGNDTLVGGELADELSGGVGDDQLFGRKGNDRMDGGEGIDLLSGGLGNDSLTGGDGIDFFDDANGINVVTDFTPGEDKIVAAGGRAGVESIVADGNDTLITFASPSVNRTMRLLGVSPDRLKNVDFLDGVAGSGKAELLQGGAGWDVVLAGAGSDSVDGGDGSDCLYGDLGNDLLKGGLAGDTMFGGEGDDDLQGEIGKDTLAGGRGDDKLSGGDSNDVLYGGSDAGADTLDGGEGIDTADYSGGRLGVVLDLSGKAGEIVRGTKGPPAVCVSVENAIGGSGADQLIGTDGDNRLEGRGGKDTLIGAFGADTLVGGGGEDVFVYRSIGDSTAAARDVISDAGPDDVIDLNQIDADATQDGNQAFNFGAAGRPGSLVVSYDSGTNKTTVSLYVNADDTADGVIVLSGDRQNFDNFIL
jgi:Ca2+-binding RTX toxin-like protein